jgi:dipeptidyl aminopeptidase/acylaminoacyl peptidase
MAAGQTDVKHPVIVSYHGGPAGTSVIAWRPLGAYFVSLGYVVVEPNVRGSSGFGRAFEEADNGAKRLDAFKDVETSARWAASQPWADKDRLVALGSSYGGYVVLNALARWPDIWRAGVDLVGIVNLDSFMRSTSGTIRETFLVEFGDPDKDAALFTEISPITDVDDIVDPTFVYAGANDPRVPRTESDQIVVALRKRGIATEYLVADNEGHSLARRENQLAVYARVARFLETHLK